MAPSGPPEQKGKAAPKADSKKKEKKVEKKEEDPADKIPKVEQPNKAENDAKVQAVQDEVNKMKKKQDALTEKIQANSHGKDEFNQEQAKIRAELSVVSAKMDALQEKKEEINKILGESKQQGIAMKSDLQKLQKSVGYGSEAQIDSRISEIEHKLQTETMPLKMEKELLKEVSELKKARPKVSSVNKLKDDLSAHQAGQSSGDLRATIQEINAAMAKHREEKKVIQEQLNKLRDERNSKMGDVPQWVEERKKIGEEMGEKRKEMNGIRDEFRAKEREYYQYLKLVREARSAKQQEERMAWQKERDVQFRQRKADKLEENPYLDKITLIEQTIKFCNSLVGEKKEAETKEVKEIEHTNPEGTQVLMKKEERDEEYYYAPTAKGKKGKKKGGAKAEGSAKPIKHNAETFRLFDSLKLNAPITTDEVPDLLEKLEAQLTEYNEKVKEWEDTKEEQKRKILAGEDKEEAKAEDKEEAKEEEKEEEKGE